MKSNTNENYVQVSTAETRNRQGRIYHCSGNLFVCKETSRTIPHNFINCTRSVVTGFSAGAATRMRRYLRGCVAEYRVMLTLTYPGFYPSDGRTVKEHLRRFLQELKRNIERDGVPTKSYSSFWFLEFQTRGAPHFHIFTTHRFNKDWVAKRWYEIVNSEDTRHLTAGTRVEAIRTGRGGTISYASKYAAKEQQKVVPEGYESVGRFWGVSGQRGVVSADTFVSLGDMDDEAISHRSKMVLSAVKQAIETGNAEIVARSAGAVVVTFNERVSAKKVRVEICKLGCLTMRHPQMFDTAEIDYTGDYHG